MYKKPFANMAGIVGVLRDFSLFGGCPVHDQKWVEPTIGGATCREGIGKRKIK
jgi:hypothetical protein